MRVTVVGAGGVGGYFGGRLVQAGVDVTFVARGAHLAALNTDGLRVRSVRGDFMVPVRAAHDLGSSGTADYVVVAVKSFDTDRVASMLGPLVGDDTAVVSLQNGVDNEERLAAVLGDDRVVGGAAYIFATIAEPGMIDHTGGPASLVVGEWRGGTSRRDAALVEAFRAAEVTADESPDIRAVLWSKFAFICAQAGVTAAVRLPIGEIRSQPAGRELFRNLAAEVCAVAAAEGSTCLLTYRSELSASPTLWSLEAAPRCTTPWSTDVPWSWTRSSVRSSGAATTDASRCRRRRPFTASCSRGPRAPCDPIRSDRPDPWSRAQVRSHSPRARPTPRPLASGEATNDAVATCAPRPGRLGPGFAEPRSMPSASISTTVTPRSWSSHNERAEAPSSGSR